MSVAFNPFTLIGLSDRRQEFGLLFRSDLERVARVVGIEHFHGNTRALGQAAVFEYHLAVSNNAGQDFCSCFRCHVYTIAPSRVGRYPHTVEHEMESVESWSPLELPPVEELVTDDGEPMESERHKKQMDLLIASLELAWAERQDFYVGGNMALYFSPRQIRNNDFRGPDVFVVTETERRERKAWVLWEEEGRVPDVIIELISPSTEKEDRGPKKETYRRLRVANYFLFDPFSAKLEGFEFDFRTRRYVRKVPDRQGRLRCEPLGLWLGTHRHRFQGLEAQWLCWFDGAGNFLPEPEWVAQKQKARADAAEERAESAEARLGQETERAESAEARAKLAEANAERMAAKLRELGVEEG